MKEMNDFILGDLPTDDIDNLLVHEEEMKDIEGVFIHGDNPLQKTMRINKQRSSLKVPDSRFTIDDNKFHKIKKLDNTVYHEKQYDDDVEDEESFEYLNPGIDFKVHEKSRFLDVNQILNLEDPFTSRISRPSKNYMNFSVMNRKKKNAKKKKKNNFLKEKTMEHKIKEKEKNKDRGLLGEEDNIYNINEIDESDDKDLKRDSINKIDDVEEEENEGEDEENEIFVEGDDKNGFIKFTRTNVLSRDDLDDDDDHFEVEVADSVGMTILQVINCMVKANLVQIAMCIKELGLIWGPITIITIGIMCLISLYLLLEVNKATGQRSYLIFSEMIFGHFGSIIILICQFMSAFGGCLSFIVIFNKVIPKVFTFSMSNDYIADDKVFTTSLAVILLFYCYRQDVNIIKEAAKYAVFAILLFFVLTIIDFAVAVFSQKRLISINSTWNEKKKYEILNGLNDPNHENRLANIITAIACIILSFSFHVFTFSIYGCMGKITRQQFYITTSISVIITMIIYLICGIIGYLLYSDTLTDSILDSIQESWLSCFLSIANVINVVMTFPITFAAAKNYFVLFAGIIATLFRDFFLWMFSCIPQVNNYREMVSNESITKVFLKDNKSYLMSGKPLVQIPKFIEFFLTLLLYALVFWVASIYTHLKVIFSITGGVMGNILSFIFPSIFYLGLVKTQHFSIYKIVAVCFVLFGLTTMGICIFSTILSL